MKRLVISIILAVVLVLAPVSVALAAADTAIVTVTAVPSFVSISETTTTWTINGLTGNGAIDANTLYYSNPLGDTTAPVGATVAPGECYFEIINASTVSTNIKVDFGAFTGGDATMTNSEGGSAVNAATTFGASVWYDGMTYANKVISQSTGSANLKAGQAATTNLKWGIEILTRQTAFAGGTSSEATITITATSV